MKCQSCEEVIPSKFNHAIKVNCCPYCGGQIMDEKLQAIISELQVCMKAAEPYMEAVEEWFSSNYQMRKGGKINRGIESSSAALGSDDENFDEETLKRQTELAKSTIDFQQRAGVKKSGIKSIVDQIRGGSGAADPSEFVGIDPDYGPIDMSDEASGEPLSQMDTVEMMQAMGAVNNSNSDYDPVKEYYEIEKLKRLRGSQPSGQGKFSRSE